MWAIAWENRSHGKEKGGTDRYIYLEVSMALLVDWNNSETVHWKPSFPVQIICIS